MSGKPTPHKAVLLLSIIEMIEKGKISSNMIKLTDKLIESFKRLWDQYVGDIATLQPKIITPFWHMQSEPFWRLMSHTGTEVTSDNIIGSPYSISNIRKRVICVDMDSQLFELLKNYDTREKIRAVLISTYLQHTHIQR